MPTALEIHPAIGIARVGTSEEFFIGPEPDGLPPAGYRAADGGLLRQAARFRIFECERDSSGRLLSARELTASAVRIQWTGHLVNRKAAAPRFLGTGRRNEAAGDDASDRELLIDPGRRSVSDSDQTARFDTGRFKGVLVPLGEIRMEASGRLLVLGGFGTSRSVTPDGVPKKIESFADNDTWHDDVADGPIRATITFPDTGRSVEARPAWVIVAPPDYAPGISNLVTLYDVVYDLAVERGLLSVPTVPSFDRHIQPLLNRVLGYQWVNRQARQGHGPHGPGNFHALLDDISDPTTGGALRRRIFGLLRNPEGPSPPTVRMPRLNDNQNSGAVLPLTRTQYRIMQAWAKGEFVKQDPTDAASELLPDALDRTALESCSGGGFFPGIEAGRIMKEATRYMDGEPFRLTDDPRKLRPGEITAQNAVPWQADFHLCRWEAEKPSGESRELGWWPAQRPDDVFPRANATQMVPWARGLGERFEDMVEKWHLLGVVVKKDGPAGQTVFVESERDPGQVLSPG